ncbi:hypothetical protein PT274_04675 [Leuconostocaceae bacterium ESL0958]|nr:hypothetical protein [Leuconostocaceae bacterium ESL0958]
MKKSTVTISITALVLMFLSLTTWILKAEDLALIFANLGTVILLVVYLWGNRQNDEEN